MKRLLLSILVGLALTPGAGRAANYFNPNGGVVSSPIDIHATSFTNYGTFNLGGSVLTNINGTYFSVIAPLGQPFETWDTLNFYNKGRMTCYPGWRFDTLSSSNGSRRLAANFVSQNPGVIEALDTGFVVLGGSTPCNVATYSPSHLTIWATNITIGAGIPGGASLTVGANGGLDVVGTNVNLSTSGLQVSPVWTEPFSVILLSSNQFIPDFAVYDQYWAQSSFSKALPLGTAGLWNGIVARAQGVPSPPCAGPPLQPQSAPPFSLFGPAADSYINVAQGGYATITVTNALGITRNLIIATNINKGAVFVGAPSDFNVQLGFVGPYEDNFDTIGVLLSVPLSNTVTTYPQDAYIAVWDTLASQPPPPPPSRGLLTNIIGCPAITARPANYYVWRSPVSPGSAGNNGYPDPNFFISSGAYLLYSNTITVDMVTNAVLTGGDFAAYSAFLDNVVSRPAPIPGSDVTNLPGRIRINADSLDMTQARLRGEGEIMIQTSRLIASSNAVVDCQNLSFNLTSAAGNLKIQNLAPDNVARLRGQIYAWSAVWSNSATIVINDNFGSTNDPNGNPVFFRSPLTNVVYMGLHTLMLDASSVQSVLPVSVYDLTTHSTNVVIHDNMSVIQTLSIDARSLTLQGNLSLPGFSPPNPVTGFPSLTPAIQNWTFPLASNLLYFTNNGTFSIANEAHFGDDGPKPYSVFMNTGAISAASIQLNSAYVENDGSLLARVGSLIMQGGSGKLQNGSSTSGGEMQFWFGNLKLDHYQAQAQNNALNFWVTNSLADAGAASGNVLEAQNGFNLYLKPPIGDLLGTTLQTTALNVPSVFISHVWAGQDRGASAAGYSNNVAVGKLVLANSGPHPIFYFTGAGVTNGLYVDFLDLSQLSDYANQIRIDPSLTIYYAAAALSFTPPPTNGVPQEPEEYLNGQFGGHLRWVSGFAGPNSSVAVVSNGVSIMVNRALRYSLIIDSNGNGIPNGLDFYPFNTSIMARLAVPNTPPPAVSLSWNGVSHKVYQIQTTTNFLSASWQTLFYYTNSAATNGTVSVNIPVSPGATRQFYRVGVVLP